MSDPRETLLGSTGRWPVVFGGSPKTSGNVHVQEKEQD
jgi:hypothetical protein